jgi:transcriptional regulator with XRE-family HTH domain
MKTVEIGQRIKRVRTEINKLSQFEFSEHIGITQANLSMLENGKICPSCFLLIKLNLLYKININWLITGQGNIMIEEQVKEENKK